MTGLFVDHLVLLGGVHPVRQPVRHRRCDLPGGQARRRRLGRRAARPVPRTRSGSSRWASPPAAWSAGWCCSAFIVQRLATRRRIPFADPGVPDHRGLGAVLWAVSLAVPGPARYVLWASRRAGVGGRPGAGHPASRTGCRCTSSTCRSGSRCWSSWFSARRSAARRAACTTRPGPWSRSSSGSLAFAVAAGMWWIYFDITAPSSSRELREAEEEDGSRPTVLGGACFDDDRRSDQATDGRHDLFIYAHLPLTYGIVLAGVGLEELVVHPDSPARRPPPGPSPRAWRSS